LDKNKNNWMINIFIIILVIEVLFLSWKYREEINAKVYNTDNRYVTKEELENVKKEIISKIPSFNYIPFIVNNSEETQEPTEIIDNFGIRNVIDFGATPDDGIDDTEYILLAINDLSETGGIVFFPPGEFIVTETLVLGNKSKTQISNINGITIRGSGTGKSGYYTWETQDGNGTSVLKWMGIKNGTVININGAEGCVLENFSIDGNKIASTLIDADFAFRLRVSNILGYSWANGYAIKIWNQVGEQGGHAQIDQYWEKVDMINPHDNFAGGLDIASTGSYNVNELTFEQSVLMRSNSEEKVASIRLGYTDHVRFIGCLLAPSRPSNKWSDNSQKNNIAIEVKPINDFENRNNLYQFPANITFIATPFYGGIWHNNVDRDRIGQQTMLPALIFYPYYTGDNQPVPPLDYKKEKTLPYDFVGGFTDTGIKLNP